MLSGVGTVNTINSNFIGIPSYLFFAVIGLVFASFVYIDSLYKKYYPIKINVKIMLVSLIGMVLFAKLFGCISGAYRMIGLGNHISWVSIKNTGIVFYGGLIGFYITFYLLARIYKQNVCIVDLVSVCVPLFHTFARIGCFYAGCCYGMVSNHFSVEYTTLINSDICTEHRVPIQLIEAAFNFGLFLYLKCLFKKPDWKDKNLCRRYLVIYSIGRFVLEFLRGDECRGVICGLSFSQMISISIWVFLIAQYFKSRVNCKEDICCDCNS